MDNQTPTQSVEKTQDEQPKKSDSLSSILDSAKNYRTRFTPQWYINVNAYENNHFLVWLPKNKKISRVPIGNGQFFNQIPEVKNQVDTIQNMILATEIVPVVYPVYFDKVSTYWAGKISDYLLDLYDKWFFNGVLHDAVHDALVMPYSVFQIIPPEDNFGDMGLIERDAFEVLLPPGIKDIQQPDCNWVGLSVRKPVEEIQANKIYSNTKDIKPDGKFSSVDYKDILMGERFSQPDTNKKTGTAVVDELYLKERQSDGKIKIRIRSYCQGTKIRSELTKWEKLPFISLKLHQGLLMQPSFVEYITPGNRSIDILMSRIEESAIRNTRDFLLAQYGSNVTRVKDKEGERIEYRGNMKPEYLKRPEFPKDIMQYVNMNFQLIERTGASSVSMGAGGRQGSKAYRSQEAQRQQDFSQQKTPMDFVKIALTQLFNTVIYFAAQYYLEPHDVKIYERENYNVFQVLGEKGVKHNMDAFQNAQGDMAKAPVVIHPKNVVKVEFEKALSYTMEGKRQTIFQAVQIGLLGKEDALRMLGMGNVRDILENLQKEQEQQQSQDVTKARAMQLANADAASQAQGNTGNQAPTPPDTQGQAGGAPTQPAQGQQPEQPAMSPQQMQQVARQVNPTSNGMAKKPIRLPGIRVGQ